MFKKLNSKILLIALAILIIILGLTQFFDYKSGDRTFKKELETIDSASVTNITIIPKGGDIKKTVTLSKVDNKWKFIKDGKKFSADESFIANLISELAKLDVQRVAATDKSKWKDFQVTDSLGLRIKVEENNKTTANLVVGKFSYQREYRKVSTFIRVSGEDEVYAVEGFLNVMFNNDFNNLRNRIIFKENKDNITKLTFSYPGSTFNLIKDKNKWLLNGLPTDSAFVENYINSLSTMGSNDFVDDVNKTSLGKPYYSLKIEGKNFAQAEINAYQSDALNKFLINSSQNSDTYFSGGKNGLFDKIFITQDKLVKK